MYRKASLIAVCMILLAQAALAYNPPYDPNKSGGVYTQNGYRFTMDYYESGGSYYGDAALGAAGAQAPFEIWEIGSKIESNSLLFSIWQDLPETGAVFNDSYQNNAHISPGDLWIVVGSCDPFDPNAEVHAVALTDRTQSPDYNALYGGNVVRQKYGDVAWQDVTKGNLYKDADAATGTFETYQKHMMDQDEWYWMNDQDGDDEKNSYMSLIKGYEEEVRGKSSVEWDLEQYWGWDPDANAGLGDWVLTDAWRITGSVDLDAIGLQPGDQYTLFISMECGNDAAKTECPVPEPGVLSVLIGGLAATTLRRRRK
jgi:hypothetical protein